MDALTAGQSRHIGSIMVEKNLITAEQLERALKMQETTGASLSEIVGAEFGVSRPDVLRVLAESRAEPGSPEPGRRLTSDLLTQPEPPTSADVLRRRPIGEIFVELGFISNEQLEAALDVQRTTGVRLGEILVEQGALTRLDLASALAEHWEPRKPVSEANPPSSSEETEWLAADMAIAELELRLRVVEARLDATPPARRRWGRRRASTSTESAFHVQVSALAERVAALGNTEASIADLQRSIERLDAVRASDGIAIGARLAGVEQAIAALEKPVEQAVDSGLADRVQALASRLDHAERGLEAGVPLEERFAALARIVTELQSKLETRAARPANDELGERLVELSLQIERTGRDGAEMVAGLAGELRAEASARAADLASRLQEHSDETAALRASLEEVQAAAVQAEQGSLQAKTDELQGEAGQQQVTGAEPVETDERIASLAPLPEADGYVAFAPTAAGYVLIELPGRLPEIGSMVEVESFEGALVVTRYGRSPLPFDGRPCAYLGRA